MHQISQITKSKRCAGLLATTLGLSVILLGITSPSQAQAGDANQANIATKTYSQASEKAGALLRTGNYSAAFDSWQGAIKLAKTPKEDVDAKVGITQSLIGLKRFDDAEETIEQLRAAPEELLSKTTLQGFSILVLRGQGKYAEAVTATNRMLESSSENFPSVKFDANGKVAPLTQADVPQLLYGSILGDISGLTPAQVQEALKQVAADPKASPFKREQAKIYVGDFLLYQGKTLEARQSYLDTDAKNLGVWTQVARLTKIGDTYSIVRDWSQAASYYDQALAVAGATPTDLTEVQRKRAYVARYIRQR